VKFEFGLSLAPAIPQAAEEHEDGFYGLSAPPLMASIANVGEEHRTYHWGADQPTDQRLTVAQAAAVLGITEGAVRSRIKRGTLPTTKEGGTVFVLWGGGTSQANQTPNPSVPTDQAPPELVEALQYQIRDLREQLGQANEQDRKKRRIIAALNE
jgi:hypothetical protein